MVPSATPRQLEFKQASSMLPPQRELTPIPLPSSPTPRSNPPPVPCTFPSTEYFETTLDELNFFRRYHFKPARDADNEESPDTLVDSTDVAPSEEHAGTPVYSTPLRAFQHKVSDKLQKALSWFHPFQNPTIFRIMHWAYTGSASKSHLEVQRLVQDVLLSPDFDREHLRGFSIKHQERLLDKAILTEESLAAQGWINDTIEIALPKERIKYATMADVPKIKIEGAWRRPVTPITEGICKDPLLSKHRQFNGYELWHKDPVTGETERVFGEIFTSDAFLEEETRIRALPRNPEDTDDVEYVVFPWGLYSDGTHLANFGTASLWPVYAYDLGLPKDVCSKPSNFAANHIAYIPSVSRSVLVIRHFIDNGSSFRILCRMCTRRNTVKQPPPKYCGYARQS